MLCEKLLLFISVSIQSTLLGYSESCLHIPNNHTAGLWHCRQEALPGQNSSFSPGSGCWMMNCADKTSQSVYTIRLLSSCEALKYTDESEGEALTGCYLLLECDASHDLIMIHQGQLIQLLGAQVRVCALLLPAERRNKTHIQRCVSTARQTKHTHSYYLCIKWYKPFLHYLTAFLISYSVTT